MLRVLLGASLGLGMLDLAWLDLVAAPAAISHPSPSPRPVLAMALALPPPPAIEPVVESPPKPAAAPAPTVEHIYFTTLHANVDHAALGTLATLVPRSAHATITLEGHADYRGAEAVNAWLRRGRAVATRETLVRLGVPRDHITIRVAPPADSAPEVELWRDRRVDIALDPVRTP